MLFKVREYRLKLVSTLLRPCRSTTKRVEVEQTDRQTDRQTHKNDYRNPPAHAPRVNKAKLHDQLHQGFIQDFLVGGGGGKCVGVREHTTHTC